MSYSHWFGLRPTAVGSAQSASGAQAVERRNPRLHIIFRSGPTALSCALGPTALSCALGPTALSCALGPTALSWSVSPAGTGPLTADRAVPAPEADGPATECEVPVGEAGGPAADAGVLVEEVDVPGAKADVPVVPLGLDPSPPCPSDALVSSTGDLCSTISSRTEWIRSRQPSDVKRSDT